MPSKEIGSVFAALADDTRRDILARLRSGSITVGALAAHYPISGPAISRHLKVLERAGLISRSTQGQWHTLTLRAEGLEAAGAWIERQRGYWEGRLDELERHLEQQPAEDRRPADDRSRGESR